MLFFKKKQKFKQRDWNDITLDKFYKLKDILEVKDEYMAFNLIDLIYDIDSSTMPVSELSKYNINFLKDEIPNKNVKLEETYILNGKKYKSNINLTSVKTNLFIDFTNYSKEENKRFEKLLSVFIIPDGHEYNDGYNMKEVQDDILQLPIAVVQSLSFFMIKLLLLFVIIFQSSLEEELKKMNLPKDLQMIISEILKETKALASFQS